MAFCYCRKRNRGVKGKVLTEQKVENYFCFINELKMPHAWSCLSMIQVLLVNNMVKRSIVKLNNGTPKGDSIWGLNGDKLGWHQLSVKWDSTGDWSFDIKLICQWKVSIICGWVGSQSIFFSIATLSLFQELLKIIFFRCVIFLQISFLLYYLYLCPYLYDLYYLYLYCFCYLYLFYLFFFITIDLPSIISTS